MQVNELKEYGYLPVYNKTDGLLRNRLADALHGLPVKRVVVVPGFNAATDGNCIFLGRELVLRLPTTVLRDIVVHEQGHIALSHVPQTTLLDTLVSAGMLMPRERTMLAHYMELEADAVTAMLAVIEGRSLRDYGRFLAPTPPGRDHPSGKLRVEVLKSVLGVIRAGLTDIRNAIPLAYF